MPFMVEGILETSRTPICLEEVHKASSPTDARVLGALVYPKAIAISRTPVTRFPTLLSEIPPEQKPPLGLQHCAGLLGSLS